MLRFKHNLGAAWGCYVLFRDNVSEYHTITAADWKAPRARVVKPLIVLYLLALWEIINLFSIIYNLFRDQTLVFHPRWWGLFILLPLEWLWIISACFNRKLWSCFFQRGLLGNAVFLVPRSWVVRCPTQPGTVFWSAEGVRHYWKSLSRCDMFFRCSRKLLYSVEVTCCYTATKFTPHPFKKETQFTRTSATCR